MNLSELVSMTLSQIDSVKSFEIVGMSFYEIISI